MSAGDLRDIIAGLGYTVENERLVVSLPGRRSQMITVRATEDAIEFITPVASARAVEEAGKGPIWLMELNRHSELVQYCIDERGRWVARSGMPPGAVDARELHIRVTALAGAADRVEQAISGKDLY